TDLAALPMDDPGQADAQEAKTRAELDAAREALKRAEARADAARAALSEARARRDAIAASTATQTRRKDQLTSDAERLTADLAAIADAGQLTTALIAARASEESAEAAARDADAAVERCEMTLETARKAESDAEGPFQAAKKDVSALEAELAGLDRLLRRAEGPQAPPVIEQIRTQAGYEKAIAAALGDDLQASTDRASALHWAGAAAFDQTLPAGATALTDYTDAPGELSARLSQCGLVDADDGARLAQALKPGQRLVSRSGHLWRWDGFTRTPDAPVSAAERLEQQARRDAAQSEFTPAKTALEAAETKLETARTERWSAEMALKEARAATAPAARALADARANTTKAAQAADSAAMKRDAAEAALARVRDDLAAVSEALALAAPDAAIDDTSLESERDDAQAALIAARDAEVEARGKLTDLTRGREQAAARREALSREAAQWTQRAHAATSRLDALLDRRRTLSGDAEAAARKPEQLASALQSRAADVERLETERKRAADALAEKDTAVREAETGARAAAVAASSAREALAAAAVRQENAQARLSETVDLAKANFQRTPEGLETLARAGIDGDTLDTLDLREAERRCDGLKRDRDALGGVNMDAETEAEALAERLGTQAEEKADLTAAIAKLRAGVDALNAEGRDRLIAAFEQVNAHFKALFTALFRGGQAELKLVDAEDPLAAGLEIMAQPPGKRLGTLNLMSGGEQALTAAALIFAVFLSRPAPICVLDEVDAPLDDANVDRFCRMLNEMRQRTDTRFVVITHNPVTMSRMDRLFGVTMREKGVSKLVSVDLGTAETLVTAA
ncbi:MAG: chromosome segregation protein SMC, partial [Pseudomonadota bacterium]